MTVSTEGRTSEALLEILRSREGFVSGEEMARRLGVSRAAVWKGIQTLRRKGYEIEAQLAKGYRLVASPKGLSALEIKRGLRCRLLGRKVHLFQVVDSTNTVAYRRALKGAEEGEVFLAESQTGGRGRMGRSWSSPAGLNLYLSVLLRPQLPPAKVPLITLMAAVASAEAVEEATGLRPEIKWPNDLLLRGRKLGGILAEAASEADLIAFLVLGIGINVNALARDFPEDVRGVATSLRQELGREVDRVEVIRALLERLEAWYVRLLEGDAQGVIQTWEELARVRGRLVEVAFMGDRVRGEVQGVDEDGALLLREGGRERRVVAGDLKVLRW